MKYTMKDGTVKHNNDMTSDDRMDFDGIKIKPGYYVWWSMWKGPFTTPEEAKSAYAGWVGEKKQS